MEGYKKSQSELCHRVVFELTGILYNKHIPDSSEFGKDRRNLEKELHATFVTLGEKFQPDKDNSVFLKSILDKLTTIEERYPKLDITSVKSDLGNVINIIKNDLK